LIKLANQKKPKKEKPKNMPLIKRQAPSLLPEDEYCGQFRHVGVAYVKDTDTVEYTLPIHLPDKRMITTRYRILSNNTFVFENICKSCGISLEPGQTEEATYQLNGDDLENRRCYFQVVHVVLPDGRKVANGKFHAPSYATRIKPSLTGVSFPNEPPPITLRPVIMPVNTIPAPASATQTAPPTTATATPPANQTPVPAAPETVEDDLTGITDAEMQEALEYARKLRAQKQGPKA
jgi:hypothetical protein